MNSLKQTITTTTRNNKHCAILPSLCRHCQSKAKHSRIWAQAMPFLSIKQVDLWPFDLETGVRVTCDVDYLCANFSLPRPLHSRVTPDVCDRQTDVVRQKHRLMPPAYGDGGVITLISCLQLLHYRVYHPRVSLFKFTSSTSFPSVSGFNAVTYAYMQASSDTSFTVPGCLKCFHSAAHRYILLITLSPF